MFGFGSRGKVSREDERNRMIRSAQVVQSTNGTVCTVQRCSVREIKEYGALYYLICDKSSFDPWSCKPVLTFAALDPAVSFPATYLFETRHFLGSTAVPTENKIIVNHFQYGETNKKRIKFSVLHINEDYTSTLVSEICIDAGDVAGSGLCGKFTSPEVGTYLCVWGDLSNNDYFTVGKMSAAMEEVSPEGTVQTFRLKPKHLPLGFQRLEDVYFTESDALYTSRVFPPGSSHPNHLVLQVYLSGTSSAGDLSMPFHRVAILPFQYVPPQEGEFDSQVLQYKQVNDSQGFSERFLVRVSLRQQGVTEEQEVTFLLKAPTNEVLDMCTSPVGEGVACCIDHDNRAIVRVVQTRGQVSFEESMRDLLRAKKAIKAPLATVAEEEAGET